jgi:hypothetical protein
MSWLARLGMVDAAVGVVPSPADLADRWSSPYGRSLSMGAPVRGEPGQRAAAAEQVLQEGGEPFALGRWDDPSRRAEFVATSPLGRRSHLRHPPVPLRAREWRHKAAISTLFQASLAAMRYGCSNRMLGYGRVTAQVAGRECRARPVPRRSVHVGRGTSGRLAAGRRHRQ